MTLTRVWAISIRTDGILVTCVASSHTFIHIWKMSRLNILNTQQVKIYDGYPFELIDDKQTLI